MSPLLDVKAAARVLGISHWGVRSYIKAGKLTPVRIGRLVRVTEDDLQQFIQKAKQSQSNVSSVQS